MGTKAKVRVEFELYLNQGWPDKATVSDIREQAKAEALTTIHKAFTQLKYEIVGQPEVIMIITETRDEKSNS